MEIGRGIYKFICLKCNNAGDMVYKSYAIFFLQPVKNVWNCLCNDIFFKWKVNLIALGDLLIYETFIF